jgi:hypothetical protein
MTSPGGDQADPTGLSFATDRLTMNIHGNADTHLDALCHVIYRASLYNGVQASTVTGTAAAELSVEVARDGVAGRGVLLDIPRLRGVSWPKAPAVRCTYWPSTRWACTCAARLRRLPGRGPLVTTSVRKKHPGSFGPNDFIV